MNDNDLRLTVDALNWAADEIDRLKLAEAELAIAGVQVRQLTEMLKRAEIALAKIAAHNSGMKAGLAARQAAIARKALA